MTFYGGGGWRCNQRYHSDSYMSLIVCKCILNVRVYKCMFVCLLLLLLFFVVVVFVVFVFVVFFGGGWMRQTLNPATRNSFRTDFTASLFTYFVS